MATTATPTKTKPKAKTTSGAKPEVVARQEVQSTAKWVRISPRKARLVADHIRGRSVPEARTVLAFSDRAAAIEIDKVLRSAVANAEANHGMFGDDLIISAAYVDVGPTIKRWRARARGRVARIKKRTCHITIALALPEEQAIPAPLPKPAPVAAPVPEPELEAEAVEEEAPKPKRAPRKKAADAAETAEEKPKPKRAPRKKAETAEAEEKPKPKRAPRKKAEPKASADKPKTTPKKKTEDS
jgi:large subunit ribosomal protein L22